VFRFFAISALSLTIFPWQEVHDFFSFLAYSCVPYMDDVQTAMPDNSTAAGRMSFIVRIAFTSKFGI